MAIRMTGLNSGLNTESIVAALMSAQRTKQTKIENKKTKLEWKQEVWSSLNTKIYDFYKNSLSKIRMQSNYRTKAATSSNASKVTATASTSAATGNYSITVDQIASAQKVTSGKLTGVIAKDDEGNPILAKKNDKNAVLLRNEKGEVILDEKGEETYAATAAATSKTKLTDLVNAAGQPTFDVGEKKQVQIKIEAGDKTVYLDVDKNTTIQNFVDKLQSAGLSASFDEKQQRFFIGSNKSGDGNSFKITSATMSDKQSYATTALKEFIGYSNLSASNKTIADNLMAGLQQDETKTIDDVIEQFATFANNNKQSEVKKLATEFYTEVAEKKAREALDTAVFEENSSLSDRDYAEYLNQKGYKIDITKSDEELKKDVKAAKEKYIDKEAKKLLSSNDYKTKISNAVESGLGEKTIKIELGLTDSDKDKNTIEEYKEKYAFADSMKRAQETDDAITDIITNYKNEMSAMEGQFESSSNTGSELHALGLTKVDGKSDIGEKDVVEGSESGKLKNDGTGMVVIAAKNTKIQYNGATLESDTTNISVSGLELNILSETKGETVNISVTNDTSAVYDTIKDFITEYNSILTEMNKYYGADTAKGYDVLTDEEKESMSESEVEKWETKIKDSLLRRDTTLSGIVSSFRNNMMGTYTSSNGKKYALSSIGISTSGDYKEGGLLHILGDEDDAEYADKDNLLKKMLDEDPDTVMQVLTKLSDNLYQDLQKKMSSTKLSGALTFYNDKEMASQLSDYKKDISTWQDKLNEIEDRYYKQFTAMEKALANMQSQQNSLANLIGS